MAQWYCSSQGQPYGPVEEAVVLDWIRQGRLKPTDLVWTQGMSQWQPLATIPQFFVPTPPPLPYSAAAYSPMIASHRGALILVMGLLSWFFCFIFGIIGWSMGSTDLKKMKQGQMDPSGKGLTMAGYVLSIVHIAIVIVALAVFAIAAWFDPTITSRIFEE